MSFEMATKKETRSRWDFDVSEAAREISIILYGVLSNLRRERVARDFSLLERGVVESGFRIDEKWRAWIWCTRKSFWQLHEFSNRSLVMEAIDVKRVKLQDLRYKTRIGVWFWKLVFFWSTKLKWLIQPVIWGNSDRKSW